MRTYTIDGVLEPDVELEVPSDITTLSHGLAGLDLAFGRIRTKGISVLAGPQGTGKTTLLISLLETVARANNTRTGFLSLEMEIPHVKSKMACGRAMVRWDAYLDHKPSRSVRTLTNDQIRAINAAFHIVNEIVGKNGLIQLFGGPMTLDDVCRTLRVWSGHGTEEDYKAEAYRQLAAQNKLKKRPGLNRADMQEAIQADKEAVAALAEKMAEYTARNPIIYWGLDWLELIDRNPGTEKLGFKAWQEMIAKELVKTAKMCDIHLNLLNQVVKGAASAKQAREGYDVDALAGTTDTQRAAWTIQMLSRAFLSAADYEHDLELTAWIKKHPRELMIERAVLIRMRKDRAGGRFDATAVLGYSHGVFHDLTYEQWEAIKRDHIAGIKQRMNDAKAKNAAQSQGVAA